MLWSIASRLQKRWTSSLYSICAADREVGARIEATNQTIDWLAPHCRHTISASVLIRPTQRSAAAHQRRGKRDGSNIIRSRFNRRRWSPPQHLADSPLYDLRMCATVRGTADAPIIRQYKLGARSARCSSHHRAPGAANLQSSGRYGEAHWKFPASCVGRSSAQTRLSN